LLKTLSVKAFDFLLWQALSRMSILTGIGGFLLLAGTFVSVVFGLIGNFTGTEFVNFLIVMITCTAASIMLGATIGLLSKYQQATTAFSMPVAIILGLIPLKK